MKHSLSSWILLLLAAAVLFPFSPSCDAAEAGECGSEAEFTYGYVVDSGAVAFSPLSVFIYCPDVGELIVHPEHDQEAIEQLGAVVVAPDQWMVDGLTLTPQFAEALIATPTNIDHLTLDDSLPAVFIDDIQLSGTDMTACTTKVKGFKCTTVDCSVGCQGRFKYSGAKNFSGCEETRNVRDRCTLTGGSNTCKITHYSGNNCTGTNLGTTTATQKKCQ